LGEERASGEADLDRVKAEDVGDRAVEVRLLAPEEIMAEGRGKPFGEPV